VVTAVSYWKSKVSQLNLVHCVVVRPVQKQGVHGT